MVEEDDPNTDVSEGAEEETPEHDETVEEVFDHGSLEYFDPGVLDVYMMDDFMEILMDGENTGTEQKPDTAKNQQEPAKETVQPDSEAVEVGSDEDQQAKKTKGTHKDRHSLAQFLTFAPLYGIHVHSACAVNTQYTSLMCACSFIDSSFRSCDNWKLCFALMHHLVKNSDTTRDYLVTTTSIWQLHWY